MRSWERDEALARQAKREGLDRNDRTIRAVLADHLRARIAQGIPNRQPTAADLDAWLARPPQRLRDAAALRLSGDRVPAVTQVGAAELAKIQRALASGVDARTLGRPLVGGNLTAPELAERLGAGRRGARPAAARGPVGTGRHAQQSLLLVRVEARLGRPAARRRAAAAPVCRLAVRAAPARRRRSAERRRSPLPIRGAPMTRTAPPAWFAALLACALAVGAGPCARARPRLRLAVAGRARGRPVRRPLARQLAGAADDVAAAVVFPPGCRLDGARLACGASGLGRRHPLPLVAGVDDARDGRRAVARRDAASARRQPRRAGGARLRRRGVAVARAAGGRRRLHAAWRPAHPDRLRPPAVRRRAGVAGARRAAAAGHHHRVHAGPQREPGRDGAGPRARAAAARRGVHRAVDRAGLRRVPAPGRVPDATGAVGDRLRVRPLARPGLRVGAAGPGRARAARAGRAALLQPGCRAGAAGGRRRRHRCCARRSAASVSTAAGCARR